MTTFKGFLVAGALSLAGFMGAASDAKADITYIVNATFDDLTQLTGDFKINVSHYVSSWDLTTATGATVSSYNYTPTTGYTSSLCGPSCESFFRTGYFGGLQLTFAAPLGSYGVDRIVAGIGSWENHSYTSGGAPIRYVTSGTVTGVPEPSSWALLLIGFAGFGVAKHRRTRRGAAA